MTAHRLSIFALLVFWSLLVLASFCLGAEDQSPALVSNLCSSALEPKPAGTDGNDYTEV